MSDGVVVKYADLTHTNYPQQEDKLRVIRDPSASEVLLINQYNSYMAMGQTALASELLVQNPSLKQCIINADTILALHHSIIAVERTFYDNILDKICRLGKQKGDWNAQMSSSSTDEQYRLNKYDVVRYPVDGVKQYFLVLGNNITTGDIPTQNVENGKYIQISMKGDRGDDGYTPVKGVDYFDGASGLGLTPRGEWIRNKEFYQYDMVSYNHSLWYCMENNLAEEPSDSSTVWKKIEISKQLAISTDVPNTLEEGGLWLQLQEDGHVLMKKRTTDGKFETIYPEVMADYVKDITGQPLQKKIYQHYFERDDVKTKLSIQNNVDKTSVYTSTATLLSNPEIVVAKCVTTDKLDVDGTCVEEFTCYDETGILIMYKCKRVLTENEDGSYTSVPEVII